MLWSSGSGTRGSQQARPVLFCPMKHCFGGLCPGKINISGQVLRLRGKVKEKAEWQIVIE
jgi:hypothetical protein